MKNFNIILPILSTSNFKYFSHFKYLRHLKYFRHFFLLTSNLRALITLSILGTFLTLGTFLSCSKPTTAEPENQRQQIEVTDNIIEDTVWKSGKDYIIRGTVVVEENITLAIEKDVHVYFDGDENKVKGLLDVQGIINANSDDSTRMIVFQSLKYGQDIELQRGLSLYNDFNHSTFNNCVFSNMLYGIQGTNTRLVARNCRFENCYNAINISKCDSLLISHCDFANNSYDIKIELSKGLTDSSIKISYNSFLNCGQIAIEINNQSLSLITDNIFKNCTEALLCNNYSRANVSFNHFINSKYCVIFKLSSGTINENQFKNGDIFVRLDYYYNSVKINYNNFEDAQKYNVYTGKLQSTQKTIGGVQRL